MLFVYRAHDKNIENFPVIVFVTGGYCGSIMISISTILLGRLRRTASRISLTKKKKNFFINVLISGITVANLYFILIHLNSH